MKRKSLIIPLIILAVDLVLILAAHACFNIIYKPTVTKADFSFSVTYELDGKKQTLQGSYTCSFVGSVGMFDPTKRFYASFYFGDTSKTGNTHVIAEKDGEQLLLYTSLYAGYLMGDPQYTTPIPDPYLAVLSKTGEELVAEEQLARFGASLVEWDFPQPIQNTIVFSHIGRFTDNSIYPMLLVAYAALLICVFGVSIDDFNFYHTDTDRLSTAFNFLLAIAIAPLLATLAKYIKFRAVGTELIYQVQYCIPALTVLCVSASVCLRRKGYATSSLIIQFLGPAIYVATLILEARG